MKLTKEQKQEAQRLVDEQYTRLKAFRDNPEHPLTLEQKRAFMAACLQHAMEYSAASYVPPAQLVSLLMRMVGAAYKTEVIISEHVESTPNTLSGCCSHKEPEVV